jgi:hypothetical protein
MTKSLKTAKKPVKKRNLFKEIKSGLVEISKKKPVKREVFKSIPLKKLLKPLDTDDYIEALQIRLVAFGNTINRLEKELEERNEYIEKIVNEHFHHLLVSNAFVVATGAIIGYVVGSLV